MKNTIKSQRRNFKSSKNAPRKLLKELEKTLRMEKNYKATEMMDVWRCEKQKFDVLMKDDGVLEKKIMNLYNRFH